MNENKKIATLIMSKDKDSSLLGVSLLNTLKNQDVTDIVWILSSDIKSKSYIPYNPITIGRHKIWYQTINKQLLCFVLKDRSWTFSYNTEPKIVE